jgi:prepilin-type processing-associated H-X9-DG protein
VPLRAPIAFVDGHVKYLRMNIYEALSYLTQPNQVE